jgi:TatD DNase family protein
LIRIQHELNQLACSYQLFGSRLHPFYIEQHAARSFGALGTNFKTESCIAVGEIGLILFKQHKQPELYLKQKQYFTDQLNLATQYNKPVLLHIRKAHADVLQILKQQHFKLGGIAHAFSGGVEEAKAFIQLGFKIGYHWANYQSKCEKTASCRCRSWT